MSREEPALLELSGVVEADIDPDAVEAAVASRQAGAVVTFAGVVRDHDHGKAVTGIDYVGHPSADQVLKEVVAEFAARDGVHAIVAQHRVGSLGIGGIALFVAVAASHRGEAFGCASDFVDTVKERLPIWKKQYLADGSYEWSQCP